MSIRVELELASGEFTTRMIHAGETVRQFQNNVGQASVSINRLTESTGTLLTTLRDIMVTLGMARAAFENVKGVATGLAGDIIKVNAEMERLQFLLKGMSTAVKPMEDAANQVKYLRDFGKEAPFSLKALSDTFVKMKSTGIDPMSGALKSLTDGLAAFGGTDETLKRATIALTQMSGKGVIQMEELRQQLGEAIPRAVELMARSMGVTMGQLIQEISKGTVEAKSAIAAFNGELERTFGGAAAEQMQTFNGMMSRMNTLFQDLALKAGEAGFFNAVKKQLTDLNTFLAGPMASDLAAKTGSALGTIVNGLRDVIVWVVQFKGELFYLGQALAIAFGSKLAINGMMAMIGGFQGMRAELALARVQFTAFQNGMAGIGGMVAGVRSLSDATAALSLAAGGLGRALPLIGTGLMFISTYALPLVAVMGTLAITFGWFADKAKDAYEELAKFGSESEKQTALAVSYLDREIEKLNQLREARKNANVVGPVAGEGIGGMVDYAEEERKQSEKVTEIRNAIDKGEEERKKRKAQQMVREREQDMADEIRQTGAKWDLLAIDRSKAFQKSIQDAQNEHKDTVRLTKAHQENERKLQLQNLDDRAAIYQSYLNNHRVMIEAGNKDEAAMATDLQAGILAKLRAIEEEKTRLAAAPLGVQKIDKPDNVEKLLERAKGKLDDVKMSISEQRAEIAGASGEYAKLAYLIEQAASKGKSFGPIDNEEIKATTESLREQQRVLDELTEKATGKKKFASEIERLATGFMDQIVEMQTKGKSEMDKFAVKAQMGMFSGKSAIKLMQEQFGATGDAAAVAAVGIGKAFDEQLADKGRSLLDVVKSLTVAWTGFSTAVNNTNVDAKLKKPSFGQSVYGGGSYMTNLIANESSGNPDAAATSSSAKGLGQFIESTWLQFLKDMHPDMLNAGKDAALDMRRNPELMREAIAWYASNNARDLSKGGVEVNDANLYLAHFLGPQGALAALTKSADTMLNAIPQLNSARAANPKPFDDLVTVGDLQKWARAKMGDQMTAPLNKNDSWNIDAAVAAAPDETSRQAVFTARALEARVNEMKATKAQADAVKDLNAEIAKTEDNTDGLRKNYAKITAEIRAGNFKFGTNIEAKEYEEIIALAQKADQAEATRQERKRIQTKLTALGESQAREQEVLAEKQADLKRQFESENKFKFSNSYYAQLAKAKRNEELADKGVAIGQVGANDRARIIAEDQRLLQQMSDYEIGLAVSTENQKSQAIEQSLMTADAARENAYQVEVTRLRNMLLLTSTNAELRGQIEAALQRKITAYAAKTAADAPIAKQMREWSDIGNNLSKAATGWLDSATDKMADFVTTGKLDFKSLADSILKDMARLAIRGAMGNLIGGMKGTPTAMGGGGGKLAVAQHHAGGFAGSVSPSRLVDPAIFADAKRWHTGTFGKTLGNDEIPIIAKRGEQVDWPENLAKMYGGAGGPTIAPSIAVTVQGSAGQSAADHAAMGEKVAKTAMVSIKKMIGDELRTQSRPGGTMPRRG